MVRPDNCSPQIYHLLEACWLEDPVKRPSFKYLAAKFEKLLGRTAKYLEMEEIAFSNPLYAGDDTGESDVICVLFMNFDFIFYMISTDATSTVGSVTTNRTTDYNDEIDISIEEKRLEVLWIAPKFKSNVNEVDNKKYLLKYDDQQIQDLLSKYDQPKNSRKIHHLAMKLRYQNDFNTFVPPNSYINSSQPDLLSLSDRQSLLSQYDTPKIKRIRSYMEMRVQSSNAGSFDDNDVELHSNRTTINDNLNLNDLEKVASKGKQISFKFSSMNDLNNRLTSTSTQN